MTGSDINNRTRACVIGLSTALLLSSSALAQTAPETATIVLGQVIVGAPTGKNSEGRGWAPKAASVGGKEPVALRETPNSVSVVTRERMDDQNLVRFDDAMRQVPGVSVVPWTATSSQIWLRGYLADITYDGVPSYDSSVADTAQFNLAMYDRVEVQKGPAGLMKGVGNPGGTVNLVRKRGLDQRMSSITTSVTSWGTYHGSFDLGGPLNSDNSLRGRLVGSGESRKFWHQGEVPSGMIYGALDFDVTDQTTLSLSAAYQKGTSKSAAGDHPAYSDGRFLDVGRSRHFYPEWNRSRYETYDLFAEVRHRFDNKWIFSTKVNHRFENRSWKDGFPVTGVDPLTMRADYMAREADFDVSHTGIDAYVSGPVHAFGREHHLTFGYNHEINGSDGMTTRNTLIPDIPIFDVDRVLPEPELEFSNGYDDRNRQGGFYGQARVRLADPLLLVTGARLSHFKAESRSIAPSPETDWKVSRRVRNEFTPYVGLIYDLTPNLSAYASYSDIFIPQTARRFDGAVLDPRIGAQVEAGLKASLLNGNLNASAALLQTRDQNRPMPDLAHPGFSLPAGESEVRGFEIEIGGSPLDNLQIAAGYTWLDSSYLTHQSLEGQAFTLFEPEHSLKAYARYTFADPKWSDWSIGGSLTYSSGMVGTGGTDRRQGDYLVLDAQIDYRVNENLAASLQLTNLLDEKYYARVGSLNSYNTYGEPRSAMLTLRSNF